MPVLCASGPAVCRFGRFEFNRRTGELRNAGMTIRIPLQAARVLALLTGHAGELVSREEIRREIWGGETFVDFDLGLNLCINRIRTALGDRARSPIYIETLSRRGYRFIGRLKAPMPVPSRKRRIKLAVLPLENLSGDGSEEYFTDGMTEEMITQLAGMAPESLGVIARTSAMHYKGTRKDIGRIGRELGVDYVVEGSVRRAEDRVRISAQLIQVSDQTHVWANTFDGFLGDILSLQGQIAHAIARQIEIAVSPSRPAGPRTAVVPEAHDAYIKGLYHFSHFSPSGVRRAVEYFGAAIETDPLYAPAYAKLATTHAWAAFWGYEQGATALLYAEDAAQRALRVDPNHADAHGALGLVHWLYHWKLAEAESEFERAVELAPNDPLHHWFLAIFVGSMREDHERAIREVDAALELDPLSIHVHANAGWVLYWARDYDRAITQARKAIDMDPTCVSAYQPLGLALVAKSRFDEAIAVLRESWQRFEDPAAFGYLGMAFGLAGRTAEARGVLTELERRAQTQDVPAQSLAWVYLGLGDHQQALDWIDRAYLAHTPIVLWLRCCPPVDPLRSEPRYQELIARLPLLPRADSLCG